MPTKPIIILGLSPGTRVLGYALISDGELLDWGVKGFKGRWTEQRPGKVKSVVQDLVDKFQIAHLALKISDTVQRTRNLDDVYARLTTFAKRKKLPLTTYSIEKLKQNCGRTKNKREILRFVQQYFPELAGYPSIEIREPNFRMFEAIAVAICSNAGRR